MRDRRLLSARGHPDRLRGREEERRGAEDGQRERRMKSGDEESQCEQIERREGEKKT